MTMLTEPDLTPIGAAAYRRALAVRDLTDAAQGPHAMQLLVHAAIAELCSLWAVEAIVYRGSPVVSVADNYEALGYAADAAARDARYTRHVDTDLVLRTHTSALLPGLLRQLARADCSDVLLACAGIDPSRYSGLAMGIGLDRALMLRKGIDDIRLLRSDDPRVASQMLDLKSYHPVSSQPPVKRDISIAVSAGRSEEELGDHLRQHLRELGLDEQLESLELLSATPGDHLPPHARERIGIQPGQNNLLLRLVIRHPIRT